jgi:hemerythrin HHE cation binding domain-containing protein
MMDIKRELFRDHEDHESLLEQLARAVEEQQENAALRECWLVFEENLFDHLDTEERYLFTVAAQAHRLEIEQLRAEHRRIRQAVLGLSVSLELHTLKKSAIDELRALLAEHGAHEERSLHHWLEIDEGILALRGVLAIRTRREFSSARLRLAPTVG